MLPTISRAASPEVQNPATAPLVFEDCSLGGSHGAIAAQCATLSVPLTDQSDNRQRLTLAITRLPARQRQALADPVVLLAGGPGQAARESFPPLLAAFEPLRERRDLLLIDQRGTGDSTRLGCDDDSAPALLEFDADRIAELTQACLDAMPQDPRWFTTSMAVRDLDQVRVALGIDRWNLYGVSYGSRVALHYLRRYEPHVRSFVLDGVVPADVVLGPDIALNADASLSAIFDRCRRSQACNDAFPDIERRTRKLLSDLANEPRKVRYEDIASGENRELTFTDTHLAVTLRLLSYSAFTAALMPSMLEDALSDQQFAPLARQAQLQSGTVSDSLATGMHNSIVCTEDVPFLIDDQTDRAALSNTYLGTELLDALLINCSVWPQGMRDDNFKEAVVSDVPALLLSGGADPVTPPAYGEQAARGLSQSRHLINADQGHMQAPHGCMPRLIARFIDTPEPASLDAGCLDRQYVPPFFVDANGPTP